MTIQEAAQRVGKSVSALRRAIKSKKLDAQIVNGKYDIRDEALYAYAEPVDRVGAPMRDTEELERLRMEDETLRHELAAAQEELERLRMDGETLRRELEIAREEVKRKDQQTENIQAQLSDASQRHDTVVMQMSKMLEYERQPFWRRWIRQKALPAPENVMDMEPGAEEEATSEEK